MTAGEPRACLFCAIARHERPAHAVYEDAHAFAFLDIHPRAPGHTMIVPKEHVETMLDLDPAAVGHLFRAVQAVTRLLTTAFRPEGFTIGINQGKASGQVVEHLHVHVLPRFTDDGGTSLHGVVNNPSGEPLEAIARRVKEAGGGLQERFTPDTL